MRVIIKYEHVNEALYYADKILVYLLMDLFHSLQFNYYIIISYFYSL